MVGADGWCEAVRVYVLLNDGCPLLFDSGSHIHRGRIMEDLRELLGTTAPGYVFLTHTDYPHTGNLGAIIRTWPETKLVVSSGILPHVELPGWVTDDQVLYGHASTSCEYGGRTIAFLDAILKDQPGTHWMFDDTTGTLFTADAFGYLFPSEADALFDDEVEDGVPMDWLKRYHESAFGSLSNPVPPGQCRLCACLCKTARPGDCAHTRQCHSPQCPPVHHKAGTGLSGDLSVKTKIYGHGIDRIGVRQITPTLYWICHCIGEGATDINGGFAADFARVNPILDPEASDINYNAYLFLDDKTFLIDTLAPKQCETMLEVLSDLLQGRPLDYMWLSHTELPVIQPPSGGLSLTCNC